MESYLSCSTDLKRLKMMFTQWIHQGVNVYLCIKVHLRYLFSIMIFFQLYLNGLMWEKCEGRHTPYYHGWINRRNKTEYYTNSHILRLCFFFFFYCRLRRPACRRSRRRRVWQTSVRRLRRSNKVLAQRRTTFPYFKNITHFD